MKDSGLFLAHCAGAHVGFDYVAAHGRSKLFIGGMKNVSSYDPIVIHSPVS
jgi:hypothetical protein